MKTLLALLMQHARREYANTELTIELNNAVYALDASTITLALSLFPWAKFRKTKGAIKLHAMIDLRGNIPTFLSITDGKVHDVKRRCCIKKQIKFTIEIISLSINFA